MRSWLIIFALAISFAEARAAVITSQSGRFLIYSSTNRFVSNVPPGSIAAEADLLALTAERVRQALVMEIPAMAAGGSQITLGIAESAPAGSPIGILTSQYSDGFKYRVAIPPVVDETRLVKGIINVLLVEFANRGGQRAAELPAWVSEGLAQQLFFSVGPKLVVDRNSNGWERTVRDGHRRTREILRANAPPTFDDLTRANVPPAGSSGEAYYQSAAHLLAQSLLSLPSGQQNFARFLQMLPGTWNWQTAFRQAFGFERMLDVEKWWSLAMIEFTSRDQRQAWSRDASLKKLDELLMTRVQFVTATNALPESKWVALHDLLREPNWNLQRDALREKAAQLGYTAPHFPPEIAALALSYKRTLESYLQRRATIGVRPGLKMSLEGQAQAIVSETMRKVAALEARKQKLAEPRVTAR